MTRLADPAALAALAAAHFGARPLRLAVVGYTVEQRDAWRDGTMPPWPELACVSAQQRARWPGEWAARVGVFENAPPDALARAIGAFLVEATGTPPRDGA